MKYVEKELSRQGRQERQDGYRNAPAWRPLFLAFAVTTMLGAARAEEKAVSYYHDVRPIFNSNCNACHKPEKNKGELDMTTFSALMKGGKHGSAIVPGEPDKSKVVEMISGDDPDMPQDGDPP